MNSLESTEMKKNRKKQKELDDQLLFDLFQPDLPLILSVPTEAPLEAYLPYPDLPCLSWPS